MQYLLYSFLFVSLYVCLGLGLVLIFCPKGLKKYTLFLSPMVGYCYLTLIGWYCYNLDLGGTDTYALAILFPPIAFLSFVYLKRRKQTTAPEKLFDSQLIAPLFVGIIAFLVISIPLFSSVDCLTSMSLGNNDIADSASISRYLKEFKRSDTVGFLGQSDIFNYMADQQIFGGSLSTAFASSLFSLDTYQLQSMSIHIFFLFGVLLVYALARESFRYNHHSAIGITALYGLSPIMYYTIYQGFQGQIIATGLALCIFLLHLQAISNCKKLSDYCQYIPLAVLFNWGISLTYPHMLPFIYSPLIAYLFFVSFHSKSRALALHWISFVIITLVITYVLSPSRAKALVTYLFLMGKVEAGWHMPFSPDAIFGLTIKNVYTQLHTKIIRLILSIPLVLIIALGFLNARKTDRKLFLLAGSFVFVVMIGYIILSFLGRTEISGWGGYKSYKLLSFFLPLILLSSLILYRNMEFTPLRRIPYFLPLSLVVLIGCNIYSSFNMSMQMSKVHSAVSKDMVDLKKIEADPCIESVNLLGSDWWDILWQTNFLMRKKLYFETTTYQGRNASNLEGQWDLIQRTKETFNQSTILGEIIPVNSSYVLKKVHRLPDDAFKAELSPIGDSLTMKAHSTITIPVKVKNNSNSIWPAKGTSNGKRIVNLAYHWLDADGRVVLWDGKRNSLLCDVKPHEEVTLNAVINAPDNPGNYILEFDMVQERVAWFRDRGSKTTTINVIVE